jgi:hypothetical protein
MLLTRTLRIGLTLVLLGTSGARGDEPEMAVPADVQFAVFVNVLKLDRNFDPSRGTTIAIVFQQEYRASVLAKDDAVSAVERLKLGMHTVALEVGSQQLLEQRVAEAVADVVYVTPLRAVDVGTIAVIARRRGLRTFTGVPAYVDLGVAVSIGTRKNRPLIIINLAGARAEGAAFSPQLLSLARIVGPR